LEELTFLTAISATKCRQDPSLSDILSKVLSKNEAYFFAQF